MGLDDETIWDQGLRALEDASVIFKVLYRKQVLAEDRMRLRERVGFRRRLWAGCSEFAVENDIPWRSGDAISRVTYLRNAFHTFVAGIDIVFRKISGFGQQEDCRQGVRV